MAICSECGSELKEGAQFCSKCGSSINNNQQETNEEIIDNRTNNEFVVKYLMVYDDMLKRYRYSKAKFVGALLFAWFFISGLFSLIMGLITFNLIGMGTFIISLIIGIIAYVICSFIGNFIRDM